MIVNIMAEVRINTLGERNERCAPSCRFLAWDGLYGAWGCRLFGCVLKREGPMPPRCPECSASPLANKII